MKSTPGKPRSKRPSNLGDEERKRRDQIQRTLVKTVVALPLYEKLEKLDGQRRKNPELDVIIDVHLDFPEGRKVAREWIMDVLALLLGSSRRESDGTLKPEEQQDQRLEPAKNADQPQYVFARIAPSVIRELVAADALPNAALLARNMPEKRVPTPREGGTAPVPRAIYQIWEDFEVFPQIWASVATVKADAARAAFTAAGRGIVWAVIDSGIDAAHPHFQHHKNLKGDVEAWHKDFTGPKPSADATPALEDRYGHGTHVAGIIAGEVPRNGDGAEHLDIRALQRVLRADSPPGRKEIIPRFLQLQSISGMAPRTQLVSLKVLDDQGRGQVSNIMSALQWIQEINAYGRWIRIHGVNLSVGYTFDPEWFACGQSQLCVEVDRLVRSGVVVVAAAGNTGYGTLATEALGARKGGLPLSINDPGNAECAITVGSTHRESPHMYGVSYFSGKGPTGDGRLKPDLLAPGEKVLSCATGTLLAEVQAKLGENPDKVPNYIEYTGTSMAAPHVSGCIASFLSVKREFIGQPERVKQIFLETATDLGRERTFQGRGLIDLMRAIQHV